MGFERKESVSSFTFPFGASFIQTVIAAAGFHQPVPQRGEAHLQARPIAEEFLRVTGLGVSGQALFINLFIKLLHGMEGCADLASFPHAPNNDLGGELALLARVAIVVADVLGVLLARVVGGDAEVRHC